jgi:hypothetical protein
MAIFKSYLYVYQRVYCCINLHIQPIFSDAEIKLAKGLAATSEAHLLQELHRSRGSRGRRSDMPWGCWRTLGTLGTLEVTDER